MFTAYPFVDTWIGNTEKISIELLKNQLNHPFILRYAGEINTKECDSSSIGYYPPDVKPGHMGVLPSAVGYDPIIRLQSGGLKAAELMMKGETHFMGIQLAEML